MTDIPKVNYSDFFQTATSGAPEPYLWQCRLACGEPPENEPAAPGPFALAFLETLLRAADGRASRQTSADKSPQEVNRTTLAE